MHKFAVPGLAALALTLAGCGEKTASDEAATNAGASSAAVAENPENAPGTALTDVVVQLPAVAGRPGVAYFNLSNGDGPARKLASVHVDGVGRTEMHETKQENGVSKMAPVKDVALEAGKTLSFAPGGYHVMLFDIDPALKAGGTTEVTLALDNGDKISAKATIRSVGGAAKKASSGDNAGHDMGAMDHMEMGHGEMVDHEM